MLSFVFQWILDGVKRGSHPSVQDSSPPLFLIFLYTVFIDEITIFTSRECVQNSFFPYFYLFYFTEKRRRKPKKNEGEDYLNTSVRGLYITTPSFPFFFMIYSGNKHSVTKDKPELSRPRFIERLSRDPLISAVTPSETKGKQKGNFLRRVFLFRKGRLDSRFFPAEVIRFIVRKKSKHFN